MADQTTLPLDLPEQPVAGTAPQPEPTSAAPAQENAPATPAAPAPAVVDEEALAARMAERIAPHFARPVADMAEAVRTITAPRPAAPELPRDVTDDEIDEAVNRGERPSRVIRQAIVAQTARIRAELQGEVRQLREQGLATLAELSAESVKTWEHYDVLKPEIDKHLAALPAEMRAQPQTVKNIYDLVRGKNGAKLEALAVEKALRQNRAQPQLAPGQTQRPGPSVSPADWRESFSPEEIAAIEMRPGGIDQTARSLGFRTTEAYLKHRREAGGVQ